MVLIELAFGPPCTLIQLFRTSLASQHVPNFSHSVVSDSWHICILRFESFKHALHANVAKFKTLKIDLGRYRICVQNPSHRIWENPDWHGVNLVTRLLRNFFGMCDKSFERNVRFLRCSNSASACFELWWRRYSYPTNFINAIVKWRKCKCVTKS